MAFDRNVFTESLDQWVNISAHALLFTILPILIFEGAFSANLHLVIRQIVPVLFLAIVVTLFSTFVAGAFIRYAFPYNWDFVTATLVGTILSSTDTVAVMAILKDVGVHENVGVLVEGKKWHIGVSSCLLLQSLYRV